MLYIQVMQNSKSSVRISIQLIVSFKHMWLFLYTCQKSQVLEILKLFSALFLKIQKFLKFELYT